VGHFSFFLYTIVVMYYYLLFMLVCRISEKKEGKTLEN